MAIAIPPIEIPFSRSMIPLKSALLTAVTILLMPFPTTSKIPPPIFLAATDSAWINAANFDTSVFPPILENASEMPSFRPTIASLT